MLLDGLVGVVNTLKVRIDEYDSALRQSEALTRYALIDPLLRELGWDTANPALVRPEYTVGNSKRADYALLGEDSQLKAFIEAKKLREPLETHGIVEQVFTYATVERVRYVGLTDGDRWILDDVSDFSGGNIRKLDVCISTEPIHQSALKFLLLWRPNLASGRPVEASAPITGTQLVDVAPPAGGSPQLPAVEHIPTPVDAGWICLSDFQSEGGIPAPSAIKFATGEETTSCRYWWQLLSEVAEWLIKTEKLTAGNCPVMVSGGRNYIVHTTPANYSGTQFTNPHQLSNSLYMEKHGNIQTLIQRVKTLLQHCGVDAGQVWLKLG